MRPVEVNADSLRSVVQQLTSIAEDADGTMKMFQNLIDSIGNCWGDDDLGSIIGMIYEGAMAMVINCLLSNLDTIDGYCERLAYAAAAYDEADNYASQILRLVQQAGRNFAV